MWQLDDVLEASPQWDEFRLPALAPYAGDSSDDEPESDDDIDRAKVKPGAVVPYKKGNKKASGSSARARLRITGGDADEDSDEMPALLDVSDSDDSAILSGDSDSDDDGSDWTTDDDDGYGSDENKGLEQMLHRALHLRDGSDDDDLPDLLEDSESDSDGEKAPKPKDKNPFLKLLSNLKGTSLYGFIVHPG